jgi:hypothetical protein
LILDYSEISRRMTEYARFIGSEADAETIAHISNRPVTKKLEVLPPSLIHPQEILVEVARILDEAARDVAEGAREADHIWVWHQRHVAALDLPPLKELLTKLGIDCSGTRFGVQPHSDPDRLTWAVRKPIYVP